MKGKRYLYGWTLTRVLGTFFTPVLILSLVLPATAQASIQTQDKPPQPIVQSTSINSLINSSLADTQTDNLTLPQAPENLTASVISPRQVILSWTCNITGVTGFNLERAIDFTFSDNVTTITVTVNTTSYSDNTVLPGNTYFYRVLALGDFEMSPPSNVLLVTIPPETIPMPDQPLPTPDNFTVWISGPRQVVLSWTSNTTGISGLSLERATDLTFNENILTVTLRPDITSYIDNDVLPGKTYFYRIYSWDATRKSEYSKIVSVLLPPELVPPSDNTSNRYTTLVVPDKDTDINSKSNKIKLHVPKNAVSVPVQIEIVEHVPPSSTGMQIIDYFELNAWPDSISDNVTKTRDNSTGTSDNSSKSGTTHFQFQKSLDISINYEADDLRGVNIEAIRLYFIDENTKQLVPVYSKYDPVQKVLTASLTHFTEYVVLSSLLESGPGRVMAAQVNLHSGAATYSYPFELPPAPGGFQPKLELTYNSGSVDEMKNKQSVGSWVGTGWNLSFGHISKDLVTNEYYLNLPDGSYNLISTDSVNFHTQPESYFKIIRSENTWEARDKSGTYYRFGGTGDSQQYIDGSNYYRWDLNLVRDTNNNQMTITYIQDIRLDWVRSAYPQYLRYGTGNCIEVQFLSSFDITGDQTDGNLRTDNPKSYFVVNPPYAYGCPAPKIMENKRLNAIEVKVSGNLLRKYTFTYDVTPSELSTDYLGIFYSGRFTLKSIVQKSSNDAQSLPATTLSYENKQIYRVSSDTGYVGNPGNPADITWPYLTTINNGYGGSVYFSYTQKPGTPIIDTWSREVITAKTTYSGIGPAETTTYTYTGNPQYLGKDWRQQYRGFTQVRETDVVGNYVDHTFYTHGFVGNKDGEKLSGREHDTKWRDNEGNLLKQQTFDWVTVSAIPSPVLTYSWNFPSWTIDDTGDICASNDNFVYAIAGTQVKKLDRNGNTILAWPSGATAYGQATSIAVSPDGAYVFVGFSYCPSGSIRKFDSNGNLLGQWNTNTNSVQALAIAANGDIYAGVAVLFQWEGYDILQHKINQYNSSGGFIRDWSLYYEGASYNSPAAVAVSSDSVYVTSRRSVAPNDYLISKYSLVGNLVKADWQTGLAIGLAVDSNGNIYTIRKEDNTITKYTSEGNAILSLGTGGDKDTGFNYPRRIVSSADTIYISDCLPYQGQESNQPRIAVYATNGWEVRLNQSDETTGTKTARLRFLYDNYGNVVTTYNYGDTSIGTDDSTSWYVSSPNTTANILNKPARERVYSGIKTADDGTNLQKETYYYYDNNNSSWTIPPTKGNLTRLEQKKDASSSVSSYFTYDSYGNKLTETDPNNKTTTYSYDTTYHTYPLTKTYPVVPGGTFIESYTYDPGTNNLLTQTDVNGQTTTYQYDTFKRLIKVIKPGDTVQSPSIQYKYQNWGDISQQCVTTTIKIDANNNQWEQQFFDGLGRVVKTRTGSGPGEAIVSSVSTYNNRGLVEKQYISQSIDPQTIFLPNWNYRKQITINGSTAGAQTSYQMKLKVYKGTGTDSGNSVYLNGHCKDDFADIRFTEPDGLTLIDYWMESHIPGNSAVFWVEFDSIPASPATANFFIYYGNAGANSASNGNNTFMFFDDFNDGVFDTVNTWTIVAGKAPTESGGCAHLVGNTPISQTRSQGMFQYAKVRANVKYPNGGGALSWQHVPRFVNVYECGFFRNNDAVTIGVITSNPSGYQVNMIGNFNNAFHIYELQRLDSSVSYYIDDILRQTHSNYVPTEFEYVGMDAPDSLLQPDIDWIAVMNNVSPEPTWGIWGTEVNAPAEVYEEPGVDWKYISFAYDGLGRVITQANADGTQVTNTYGDWQTLVKNEGNHFKSYYYDAFQRLVKVEELDDDQSLYATTAYTYDILSNLKEVKDNDNNLTTLDYNWLSQKTAMSDPDMGSWSYIYDNNGNLQTQTDAKNQVITFTYDALSRLTGKTYQTGSGMTDIVYSYDDTTDGNYGKGRRTAMTDALGANSTTYKYDNRGRLIEEKRTIDSVIYTTSYTYDGADRIATITYPTSEVVTQTYNGRGIPNTLSGSVAGSLVSGTSYNQLGQVTEINLGNGLRTTYGYYGTGGAYDTTGGYYGKLWEIKTLPQVGGTVIQDVKHTWDAGGNLTQRETQTISPPPDTTPPSAVSNLAVDTPTTTSLRVTWTAPGDDGSTGTATQYDIRFSTSAINESNWASAIEATAEPAPQAAGTNQTFVVNGLNHGTTYYFAIKTADEAYNWSTISNSPSGTTSSSGVSDTRVPTSDESNTGGFTTTPLWGKVDETTPNDSDYIVAVTNGGGHATFGFNTFSVPAGSTIINLTVYFRARDASSGTNNIRASLKVGGTYYDAIATSVNPTTTFTTYNYAFSTNPKTGAAWTVDDVNGIGSNPLQAFGVAGTDFNPDIRVSMVYAGVNYTTGSPDTTPPSAVSNLAVDMPTSTSLRVTWMAPGDDGNTGTATRYDIRYSTSAINEGNWASASQVSGELLPQVAGTNQSFVVHGLSPSTTYYFAIKTADEVLNWSGISNSPSGTTSPPSSGNEIENFDYDFLDRLISVSGAYNESYTYNEIGNMMSKNGVAYTYSDSAHKHAVTLVGSTSYDYDANGNMTTRGSQTITWDVENRLVSVTGGASFVYDGDSSRVKKTESGETVLYVNKYYEKNLTTGMVTTSYYLGEKLIAQRENTTLKYIHQDHLTGTSIVSSSTGVFISSISYFPFGDRLQSQGTLGTDRLFTGQRLDNTGLYYYGARYYDPTIGRFISADTIVPNYANPQSLNRYSYCLNNPLKYVDPSGHIVNFTYGDLSIPTQLWYSNDPYISAAITIMIEAHGGQAAAKALAEESLSWYDFKGEIPLVAKAMEKAETTYNWNSDFTLEIYTPESQMIYPSTRSTTQIEGLPDINRGYQDLSISFLGITLGLMYYRQGKDMVVYPYLGDTTAVGGVSYTGSLNDISSYGVGAALQVGYGGTIQLGGSLGVDGPSGFFEYGLSLPPGVSGTAYFNIGPFVWNLPWHH